jgi:hypothetical protein
MSSKKARSSSVLLGMRCPIRRPAFITVMRSAMRATSSRWWLDIRTAAPPSARSRRMSRSKIVPAGSSALVGSSSTTKSGRCWSAAASPNRWRLPEESVRARLWAYSPSRKFGNSAGRRSASTAGSTRVRLHLVGTANGGAFDSDFVYTRMWRFEGTRWRVVLAQGVAVPPRPGLTYRPAGSRSR